MSSPIITVPLPFAAVVTAGTSWSPESETLTSAPNAAAEYAPVKARANAAAAASGDHVDFESTDIEYLLLLG